jgi:hypothetical protein
VLIRKNMVASPEDVPSGGGGVDEGRGTPPGAADPNPPGDLPAAAPAGADEGAPNSPSGDEGQPRIRQDNAIPYSRVRQMEQRWRAEERARVQQEFQQQIEPLLQQLDPKRLRQEIAVEMLTGMGMPPKKPDPKFITAEELQAEVARIHGTQDTSQAKTEMAALRAANEDLFEAYPDLEEDIANGWASPWAVENGVSLAKIGEYKVSKLREAIGRFNQGHADRAAAAPVVTPVRPQSTRTPPGPKAPDVSTDEGAAKAAQAMLARMNGRR